MSTGEGTSPRGQSRRPDGLSLGLFSAARTEQAFIIVIRVDNEGPPDGRGEASGVSLSAAVTMSGSEAGPRPKLPACWWTQPLPGGIDHFHPEARAGDAYPSAPPPDQRVRSTQLPARSSGLRLLCTP